MLKGVDLNTFSDPPNFNLQTMLFAFSLIYLVVRWSFFLCCLQHYLSKSCQSLVHDYPLPYITLSGSLSLSSQLVPVSLTTHLNLEIWSHP